MLLRRLLTATRAPIVAPPPLRGMRTTATALTRPENYPLGTLKYVPQQMIDEAPVTVIGTDHVLCVGGDDTALGHPVEYIKLDSPEPAVCKYCGLRFINAAQAAKSPEWKYLVEGNLSTLAH